MQVVDLEYVQTSKQVADGLTKALPKDAFEAFREALGLEGIWGNICMNNVKKLRTFHGGVLKWPVLGFARFLYYI